MPCSPAVTRMNVNPRLAQMLVAATDAERRARVAQQPGRLDDREQVGDPADVGEHADVGLEQEQPHQAGHGDRRGDRRGEDRAEHADAAQVLVGEHGQPDAERRRRSAR